MSHILYLFYKYLIGSFILLEKNLVNYLFKNKHSMLSHFPKFPVTFWIGSILFPFLSIIIVRFTSFLSCFIFKYPNKNH